MIRLEFDSKLPSDEILHRASVIAGKFDIPVNGNMLIMSDNFIALSALMKNCKGKIDLVYTDSPFNTMHDFFISRERANTISAVKESVAYTDRMPQEKFLAFISCMGK